MFNTNDCVPAGTFAHEIAGDVPSPGATPGAAWLNRTGTSAPSANPETVSVIAGGGGVPPRCPPPAGGFCVAISAAGTKIIVSVRTE
jgi:hypothetical protein